MDAKIFFITLAVDDLDRSLAFYRDGLGWPTDGIVGQEFHDEVTGADGTIAIFTLDGGLLLTLYERTNLAKDASLPAGPPSSTEFSLGIPAQSREEVDRLLARAQGAMVRCARRDDRTGQSTTLSHVSSSARLTKRTRSSPADSSITCSQAATRRGFSAGAGRAPRARCAPRACRARRNIARRAPPSERSWTARW